MAGEIVLVLEVGEIALVVDIELKEVVEVKVRVAILLLEEESAQVEVGIVLVLEVGEIALVVDI